MMQHASTRQEEETVLRGPIAAAALALIVGSLVPTASSAQQPSLVGQWHWNRNESTVTPNRPPPNSVVLIITAAEPARMQWTLTATDAKGQKHIESFIGTGNGTPAPVSGAPEGTVAAFTVTNSRMAVSYNNRDGSGERTTCSIAMNPGKMVCQGDETDGKGGTSSFRDVYDRW
jgi:hypothetical protein